jgi:hypothetical protein
MIRGLGCKYRNRSYESKNIKTQEYKLMQSEYIAKISKKSFHISVMMRKFHHIVQYVAV